MTSQVNGTKNGCIMKNFNKIFFAAVAAAFGLVSCSQELTPVEKPQGNLVTVNFGAEASITCPTKATLTTEDEKLFTSAWDNGDVLSVKYSNDNTVEATKSGVVSATWTTDHFEAQMPEYQGTWDYNVVYPAPDANSKVDFGSARTQKGNAYNSKYDLMKGGAIEIDADAGKTADGKNIVFEMTRQTAVAYFHLTGTLDEDVVSAKLSVEGDGAYISTSDVQIGKDNSGDIDYAKGYAFTKTEGVASKEINLTFDEGTAPKASDFKLWFNVLPTKYTKMTLTVETANHTMTISRTANAENKYEAGKLYKVVKNADSKWVKKGGDTPEGSSYTIEFNSKTKTETPLAETTKATTLIIQGSEYVIAQPFSSVSKCYYGGDATNGKPLRVGTKSDPGSVTLELSETGKVNATKIILSAKSYSATNKKTIGVNGSAKQQTGEDYTDLEFALDGSPLTSIKLDSDGYVYVKSITVVSGPVDNTIPTLSIDQTSKTWASDATDAFVVNVTVNSEGGDWMVTPATLSWATIAVDKTAGTITVTPNGANEAETANVATLIVTHASDVSLTAKISLKQNGKGGVLPISFSITGAKVTSGTVTFNAGKGAGSNAPKVYSNLLRLYAKNTITIEDSANPISKIEIEFAKQGNNTYIKTLTADSGTVTSGGAPTSGETVTDTWTSSTTPTKKVVFTLGASGQRVIKSVKVYF